MDSTMSQNILIVDDEAQIRELLSIYLIKQGFKVVTASNTAETLRRVEESPIDLVVLDIGLPGLNGYEVAKRIRLEPTLEGNVVLVALTGWGSEEDRKRAKEAGFDHHLTKPVEPSRLSELLKKIVGH